MLTIKTLYQLITDMKELSLPYLREIKEYELFRPLLEINPIEADPHQGIEAFSYNKEMVFQMIMFVAHCYSKESPYLKSSDTLFNTKTLILEDLEMADDLKERIMKWQIPELEKVISDYIKRDANETFREYFVAQNIYDRNLQAASAAFDKHGNIDIDAQTAYFEAAEKFKTKMHRIKQNFEEKSPMFDHAVKDFAQNVKSLHVVDLIM